MNLAGNYHDTNGSYPLFLNTAFSCVSRIVCISDRFLAPASNIELGRLVGQRWHGELLELPFIRDSVGIRALILLMWADQQSVEVRVNATGAS